MFTGLIERVGRIKGLERAGEGAVLTVAVDSVWDAPLTEGESVAVGGACLTLVEGGDTTFSFDVLGETLEKTNLGRKAMGAAVNLERAVRAGEPLGGHMVSGHVDGLGALTERADTGRDWVLTMECPRELLAEIVMKGSIAVDGVSVTVSGLTASSFSVSIIPFTWTHTSLNGLRVGDTVNLETDIIGKYVNRYLERREKSDGLTADDLRNAGFA